MPDLLDEQLPKFVFAKKRKRVLASLIDYAIFIGVLIFIGSFWGEKYVTEDGGTGIRVTGLPALLCFLSWIIILPFWECFNGQTIGKMICRIVVCRTDYSIISPAQSFARHFFDFVDWMPFFGMIGLLVASNNALRQRVGDLVAKTIVIEKQ